MPAAKKTAPRKHTEAKPAVEGAVEGAPVEEAVEAPHHPHEDVCTCLTGKDHAENILVVGGVCTSCGKVVRA